MAKIHIILQGNAVLCVDTNPVNSTLKGYSGLDVKELKIL